MGLVLPSGQKLTLDLLATITLEVVPFRAYAQFPALLSFFVCILEAVSCEGVLHRLRFCLDHLKCVKIADFQFYLQSGKQRNVWWIREDSHVVFGKKFSDEKGSVKRYVVVMQKPVLSLTKFRAKSSHIFTQSP
jgi:hypothetical protein